MLVHVGGEARCAGWVATAAVCVIERRGALMLLVVVLLCGPGGSVVLLLVLLGCLLTLEVLLGLVDGWELGGGSGSRGYHGEW